MTLKNGSMTPAIWVMTPFLKGQKETPGSLKGNWMFGQISKWLATWLGYSPLVKNMASRTPTWYLATPGQRYCHRDCNPRLWLANPRVQVPFWVRNTEAIVRVLHHIRPVG